MTILKRIGGIFLLLSMVALFAQCDDENDTEPQYILNVNGNGYSHMNQNALQSQLNSLPIENLSDAEESGLLFMREEEKLAHDVYTKLYEEWANQVFSNIAESEQTHTDAIKILLDRYDLSDPAESNEVAIFTDTTLQALYNELVSLGYQSEIDALKVGAAIEEIDILDLYNQLDNNVDNQDITLVYENLAKGSRNHLRAFVKNLSYRDVVYEPQYLSPEAYDEIINSDMENGRH